MPKPSEIALELGSPPGSPSRISEEFEQVPYPINTTSVDTTSYWGPPRNVVEEELPLHYMNEDKARRRVRPGAGSSQEGGGRHFDADYNDDGKELYHDKLRPANIPRIGRSIRRAPPPTNLVSIALTNLLCSFDMLR